MQPHSPAVGRDCIPFREAGALRNGDWRIELARWGVCTPRRATPHPLGYPRGGQENAAKRKVTSVKVVEIGVELEVAIGQAAMGGSLPISVSSRGGVSSAIASICM